MRWSIGRRRAAPAAIGARFEASEAVLATAQTPAGEVLVATRFGLWVAPDAQAPGERWRWDLISRATLARPDLVVVRADPVDTWPDGTIVLADRPARAFTLAGPSGLTDVVHHRVRGSVRASARWDDPAGGGWVVLRRRAGVDGLTVQVRPDPGTDLSAPAVRAQVAARLAALRGGLGGREDADSDR